MTPPVFITFTTYGSRMHGDERGSVKRGRKGTFSQVLDPDPTRAQRASSLMTGPPFELDEAQRTLVAATVKEVCAFKGWTLCAVNVRTNHVHLLVSADVAPELVMNTCKAWATRRMREAGLASADSRVWTRHGSTRFVTTDASFRRVAEYIIDGQGVDIGGLGLGPLE
ncbi:MAG: transposase [bacterium]